MTDSVRAAVARGQAGFVRRSQLGIASCGEVVRRRAAAGQWRTYSPGTTTICSESGPSRTRKCIGCPVQTTNGAAGLSYTYDTHVIPQVHLSHDSRSLQHPSRPPQHVAQPRSRERAGWKRRGGPTAPTRLLGRHVGLIVQELITRLTGLAVTLVRGQEATDAGKGHVVGIALGPGVSAGAHPRVVSAYESVPITSGSDRSAQLSAARAEVGDMAFLMLTGAVPRSASIVVGPPTPWRLGPPVRGWCHPDNKNHRSSHHRWNVGRSSAPRPPGPASTAPHRHSPHIAEAPSSTPRSVASTHWRLPAGRSRRLPHLLPDPR